MLLSKAEASGWVIALIIVGVMAILVFHGPFHDVNKVAHASGYKPIVVKMENDPTRGGKYVPADITLHVGQQVTFINDSNAAHTATATNDSFDSGAISTGGATWTWTATQAGVYKYGCSYHPHMLGKITVTG
jgi:plastocyanin